MSNAYKQAGVDITAGYEAVDRIKQHVKRTFRPEVLGGLGGFGGAIDLSAVNVKEPVLVSGTDGVGTKLMVAIETNRHDTIGIDAVAMCVNDIVTQGAEPLYFLDYIACGGLNPEKIEAIVKGVADGCEQAGCALIGGETAEMPGMYGESDYDLAGFSVGVVEKSKRLTGETIKPGDVLIGLPSSGIHSNGYSLVRKIIKDAGVSFSDVFEGTNQTVADVILTPTKIYVKTALSLINATQVKGIAHITGGGLYENVPRMFPEGIGAVINTQAWPKLPIFDWLIDKGQLNDEDVYNTFNMGIGMVFAVPADRKEEALDHLKSLGETPYVIGEVTNEPGLRLEGLTHA
ncbi:phosphoribosylformylglycinamidine cyclo-ligase [Terrilactibacillus sp. BCM23-1]|uniref:Phosphoribosylformylglycinamidine cyclo-ligase n=1 Tax=Terrilactibacillus tamarindi TaxID=2599694 RepID=A0A6N8CWJ2_9BACI|nr:phosphoribosylformylglycinamidine cyclo-ligase [Terrilactibacillus tamarindi]MTT33036.1 phosphoribosylformylglycinamidine cyclo-ligase [Terrilactibacillus tamarindi]